MSYFFPWSDKFSWFIFNEISAKYLSVNNQACLPIVLLSKNDVPWKMQLVQLTIQTIMQVLFSETRIMLQCVAEFPFTPFPFFYTKY